MNARYNGRPTTDSAAEAPGAPSLTAEFRTHLELATLAIALKKRVIVLQAVDQAQLNPGNPFENFVRTLKDDQEQVIKLESEIEGVKRSLGRLRLDRSHGIRDGIGITRRRRGPSAAHRVPAA